MTCLAGTVLRVLCFLMAHKAALCLALLATIWILAVVFMYTQVPTRHDEEIQGNQEESNDIQLIQTVWS